MRRHLFALLSLALLSSCDDGDSATPADTRTPDMTSEDTASEDTAPEDTARRDGVAEDMIAEGVAGSGIVPRLVGLWSGAATQTPLGDFPRMNMDLRPVDGEVLFARADLDADNSLRFAFSVETQGGEEVLVFRNGGQFMGLDRDTRTVFVERSEGVWRFCALERGCEYVEARWTFDGDDAVEMDVDVLGATHVQWRARRVEAREAPGEFPPEGSTGEGEVPFPEMAQLDVSLSWDDPVEEGAAVWVFLSTTGCGFTGRDCEVSRQIGGEVEAGATSATLSLPQLHEGAYVVNALLDRNGDFEDNLFPDSADQISFPDRGSATVVGGLNEVSLRIDVDVP